MACSFTWTQDYIQDLKLNLAVCSLNIFIRLSINAQELFSKSSVLLTFQPNIITQEFIKYMISNLRNITFYYKRFRKNVIKSDKVWKI